MDHTTVRAVAVGPPLDSYNATGCYMHAMWFVVQELGRIRGKKVNRTRGNFADTFKPGTKFDQDFTFWIPYTTLLYEKVDFLYPTEDSNVGIYSRKAESENITWNMYAPFSQNVWIGFCIFFVIVLFLPRSRKELTDKTLKSNIRVQGNFFPKERRKLIKPSTLIIRFYNNLWFSIRCILAQEIENFGPVKFRTSALILIAMIQICLTVFHNAYVGFLSSKLTFTEVHNINTYDQLVTLVKQNDVDRIEAFKELINFKNGFSNKTQKHLEFLANHTKVKWTYDMGSERICREIGEGKRTVAIAGALSVIASTCPNIFHFSTERLLQTWLGISTRKGNTETESMKKEVGRMIETGLYAKVNTDCKEYQKMTSVQMKKTIGDKAIKMKFLRITFLVCLSGFTIALSVFLIEKAIYENKRRVKVKVKSGNNY